MIARQMKLGAFLWATGHHIAAWRHPKAHVTAGIDIDHYIQLARMAEAAGASYFITQFSFGDLSQEEVLHSAGIFAREVLPA